MLPIPDYVILYSVVFLTNLEISCDYWISYLHSDGIVFVLSDPIRTLTDNMVVGVSKGFEKRLQLVGTGYRATLEGKDIVLNLGFSHPVRMTIPDGIQVKVEENTRIAVSGYDKSAIGQFAATIRKWRPPEPYKGKGVKYADEIVRRKEGKAGKKK